MSRWNREAALLGIPDLPAEAFKHVGDRKIKPQGGGGGSGQQTVVNTNVPDFAQGQFLDLLGRGEALSQQPYQPFQGDRVAGFSPLQQQSMWGAANMGVAPQIGTASNLAASATQGAMGMGNFAPGFFAPMGVNPSFMAAPQGVFSQSFLQPGTAGAYMSPFMQNVVDRQKMEAMRQSSIQGTQQQAEATQRGAFGGSRDAIMRAERERNLGRLMGDIQAQGSQAAFENAQNQFNTEQNAWMGAQQANQSAGLQASQQNLQAMLGAQTANQQAMLEAQRAFEQSRQFGAGLGLQGFDTALRGAGTLGQLGQQQFGQQMDILGMQNQFGGQQQALQQRLFDQQFDDFQRQRDFPYQQLGFFADLLRGAGGTTRTVFNSPQASPLQTLAGLGAVGFGLGRAKGGEVKKYAVGGGVTGGLGDQQLAQTAQQPPTPMMGLAAANEMAERQALRQAAPQGLPGMGPEQEAQDPGIEVLVEELKRAVQQGDQERAEVLRDVIAERLDPANTGIAAAAPDVVGEFAQGGIIGYERGGPVLGMYGEELPQDNGALWGRLRDAFFYNSDVARQRAREEEQVRRTPPSTHSAQTQRPDRAIPGVPSAERDRIVLERQDPRSGGLEAILAAAERVPPEEAPPATGAGSRSSAQTSRGLAAVAPLNLAGLPGMNDMDAELRRLKEMASEAEGADRERLEGEAADLEERIARRGPAQEERRARLESEEQGLDNRRDRAKNMAIVEAGLAILSADPSRGAFSAIGTGALQGLRTYKGDVAELEARRQAIFEKMDEIAELRRQEAMADEEQRGAIRSQIRGLRGDAIRTQMGLMRDVGIPIKAAQNKMVFDAAMQERDLRSRQQIAEMNASVQREGIQARAEGTGDDRAQRDADAAFSRNPEVKMLLQQAQSINAQLDPMVTQRIQRRLAEIQSDIYRQYGLTMQSAPSGALNTANDPLGILN